MSAIALMLKDLGHTVSGSDRQESGTTARLREQGVRVVVGHDAVNVDGADAVIYTAAIPSDNSEIVASRDKGIPLIERPEMLGKLMQAYDQRVAISGTHGKTTTTSMVASILDHAGLDPTVLVGTDRNNLRRGGQSIIVTEACEAFSSFLHLKSSIAAITNIDLDHVDHYGTIERIEEAFAEFGELVDPDGCIIANWDDERVRRVYSSSTRRVVRFGLGEENDIRATNVDLSNPNPSYTLVRNGVELGEIRLSIPGEQNVIDSLAAAAVAFELIVVSATPCPETSSSELRDKVSRSNAFAAIRDGLAAFRGAARRWEVLFDQNDIMVVDDYAHHPAEVAATLKGARAAYPSKRIKAVFQPHLYSRTKHFEADFADALSLAHEVIVTSIYAAREQPMDGVSGESIAERISGATYWPDKTTLAARLAASANSGDLILVLGAGDIRQVGEELARVFEGRQT